MAFILCAQLPFLCFAQKPCRESIRKLHPTEVAYGKREVAWRAKRIIRLQKDDPKKLEKLMRKKSIEIVRGPEGRLFIVDHHHHALACWEAGLDAVYVHELADFSHLEKLAFWNEMKRRKWVYLFDEEGRPIDIPQVIEIDDLRKMKDDPYRSLAAEVRDAGGFRKTDTPFMEFAWANFFRDRVHLGSSEREWKQAIKDAKQLARSTEAQGLPGFKGVKEP